MPPLVVAGDDLRRDTEQRADDEHGQLERQPERRQVLTRRGGPHHECTARDEERREHDDERAAGSDRTRGRGHADEHQRQEHVERHLDAQSPGDADAAVELLQGIRLQQQQMGEPVGPPGEPGAEEQFGTDQRNPVGREDAEEPPPRVAPDVGQRPPVEDGDDKGAGDHKAGDDEEDLHPALQLRDKPVERRLIAQPRHGHVQHEHRGRREPAQAVEPRESTGANLLHRRGGVHQAHVAIAPSAPTLEITSCCDLVHELVAEEGGPRLHCDAVDGRGGTGATRDRIALARAAATDLDR